MSLVYSVSSCSSVKFFLIYFVTVIWYILIYPGRLKFFNMIEFSFISIKMLFALKFILSVSNGHSNLPVVLAYYLSLHSVVNHFVFDVLFMFDVKCNLLLL